jgi:transcriptional regulator with XRE-family HTH domain
MFNRSRQEKTMIVYKRNHLKKMCKLSLLASQCDISPMTLSRIINNHIKPSQELAQKLADTANKLCLAEDYFKAEDFIPKHLRN